MRTIHLPLVIVLAGCTAPNPPATTPDTVLPDFEPIARMWQSHPSQPGRVQSIDKVAGLPKQVLGLCGDHRGAMADPGGDWQAGCVVFDPTLPSRRLIWAFRHDDLFLIHYESGGYAHSFHLLLAQWERGKSLAQALAVQGCVNQVTMHDVVDRSTQDTTDE